MLFLQNNDMLYTMNGAKGDKTPSRPHITERTFPPMPHNVVGIIAEYNPFHTGHAYHIEEAKRLCDASFCVVAMSGDFVQRGAPAIYDKYLRTRAALLSGADLVLELPPLFSVSSAEDFAACGTALLDRLGVVTHLCFGSERGHIDPLMDLARILAREPEEISQSIKRLTAQGLSYPKAREEALRSYLRGRDPSRQTPGLLAFPNNTLGIEYCKALLQKGSSIIPVTIPRAGAGYHDQGLSKDFSSATAIRKIILKAYRRGQPLTPEIFLSQNSLARCPLPPSASELIKEATPLACDDLSLLLSYRLLELRCQGTEPEEFADVSPELSARIKKQVLDFSSFQDRVGALKTKQYTYTRVSRCLIHILLHMTRKEVLSRKEADYCSYGRILGFRRESASLLGEIKKASDLPLITKTADAPYILSDETLAWFNQDLFCSHVYQSALEQKSGIRPDNEYTRSLILV